MSFLQAVVLAWNTIRVQKLKSFFSVIGVTIGVTFLIAVVSIVGGMSRYMQDDLIGKLIAVNSFSLRARPDFQMGDATQAQRNEWRRRPRVLDSDVPPVAASLAPDVLWAVESADNLKVESPFASPRRTQCSTVSQDWFTIKKMGVSQGRLINAQEYSAGTPVVVIGQDVADHFFPNLNPIGRELRIQSIPYTVVGVADKQGSVFGQSLDKFLLAPEKSPLNRWVNPHGVIDAMIIQGRDEVGMREAMEAGGAGRSARRQPHPTQTDK
jgi:putative ABC transport system permease protein